MKQCDFCGKELDSYHLMYCKDSDCEQKAMNFYETRRKTENIFGIINVAMIILIMVGLITAVFSPVVGNFIVAGSLVVLSVTVLILPYAPESFYKKWRIKKTSVIVRVFGVLMMLGAVGFTILALYYNSK